MRIAVSGASGRVGRDFCRLIETADDLSLANRIGPTEGEGTVPLCRADLGADMIIDFLTPATTMLRFERLPHINRAIEARRQGEVPGQNEFRFEPGSSRIDLRLSVRARTADFTLPSDMPA